MLIHCINVVDKMQGLKNISEVWKKMVLEMVPYKDQGIFRLTTVDDITQALEDHQIQLSGMKSTRFAISLWKL